MSHKKTVHQLSLESSCEELKVDIDAAFRGCAITSIMRGNKSSKHTQFFLEMHYFWKEMMTETVDVGLIRQEINLAACITKYLETLRQLAVIAELHNGEANS